MVENMNIQEFMNHIPDFLQQAFDVGDHLSQGKTELTVSLESIEKMDPIVDYLHNLWKKQLIDDAVAWNVSVSLGVLLGEIIIKEHGFHWAIIDDIPVVETDEGNRLSPITKIYKIVTDEDDTEGSPSGFYDGFKVLQQYSEMSEEEKEKIMVYINNQEE